MKSSHGIGNFLAFVDDRAPNKKIPPTCIKNNHTT